MINSRTKHFIQIKLGVTYRLLQQKYFALVFNLVLVYTIYKVID